MFGLSKKERLIKKIKALPEKKKKKLKKYLSTHCIHGVPFDRDVPCLICLSSPDIADVTEFL